MPKDRTFKLNKLVRDKIVPNHLDEGAKVKYRRLSKAQRVKALQQKILEEAKEGVDLSEIADIQEALDQLILEQGLTKSQVKDQQNAKRKMNGGFKNGDYVERETWPADHRWAKYYAKDSKRFPEVK